MHGESTESFPNGQYASGSTVHGSVVDVVIDVGMDDEVDVEVVLVSTGIVVDVVEVVVVVLVSNGIVVEVVEVVVDVVVMSGYTMLGTSSMPTSQHPGSTCARSDESLNLAQYTLMCL